MARTRSLKPGFFENELLAKQPFQWRLLYAGLWTQADRVGRLEERPARLKAKLFPYDDLKIEEGLASLADANFIVRYEVNSVRYIAIPAFLKHQHPHDNEPAAGIPPPPRNRRNLSDSESPRRALLECSESAPEGTGTSTCTSTSTSTALRARFDLFWQAYPEHKRVQEDAAWAIWRQRKPDVALTERILAALEQHKRSEQWTHSGGLYVPHPKTWLKEGQWKDTLAEPPKSGNRTHRRALPVSTGELEQVDQTQEVKRLMREGLSRKDAIARVYR